MLTPTAGTTTVSGGTLQGSLANIPGEIALANNASVVLDQATDATLAKAVSGTGSMTKTGAGTMTVSAVASYTGDTVIEQGTLKLSSAPTSPVSGAALWLDAANSASVLNTASPVTPATTGQTVAQWNNLMNTGSVKQGTDANKPIYGTHTMNGKPVLYFDGANDSLTSGGSAYGNTGGLVTAFVVQRRTADAGNYGRSVSFGDGTADYGSASNWCADNGGNGTSFYVERAGSGHSQGTLPLVNTSYMTEVVFDGTNCTAYLNGAQAGSSFASSGNFNVSRTVIGAGWDGSAANWNFTGDIAEILVYNSVLSTAERKATEAYLNAKWLGGCVGQPPADEHGHVDQRRGQFRPRRRIANHWRSVRPGKCSSRRRDVDGQQHGRLRVLGFNLGQRLAGQERRQQADIDRHESASRVRPPLAAARCKAAPRLCPRRSACRDNANVTFDQATDATFARAITGAGSMTKMGNGKLTVTGANTYIGRDLGQRWNSARQPRKHSDRSHPGQQRQRGLRSGRPTPPCPSPSRARAR